MFWWAAGNDVPNGMVKWVMSEVIICQDEALTDRVMGKQKLLYILHSCVGVQKTPEDYKEANQYWRLRYLVCD